MVDPYSLDRLKVDNSMAGVAGNAPQGLGGRPSLLVTCQRLAALHLGALPVLYALGHGLLSLPAMFLLYCAALTVGIGIRAEREIADHEHARNTALDQLTAVDDDRLKLSELNVELQHRATHDRLMGIPNRELLQTELEAALMQVDDAHRSGRSCPPVGLLFLDLDRFKYVNDTMGHQAGDALLVMVGERIKKALVGEDAMVARMGGDELVVLLRQLDAHDHLERIGDKLLGTFQNPFALEGVELHVGASVGMAASQIGEGASALFRDADAALYAAKERGRGRAVFADERIRRRRRSQIDSEMALRCAFSTGEIEAWVQPEVDLVSGEVVAGEVLARWRMGDEVANAALFIDVAERAGLLEPLMFEMAEQIWAWRKTTDCHLPLGLNISTRHLAALLHYHEDDPANRPLRGLRLEITETDLLRDLDITTALLQRARQAGAEIVLDDIGTGFSSLRMLSDLSIDGFKIDRSCLARVETDERARQLVLSLVEFGRSCRMTVIAGGVETVPQAQFLMRSGIDRGQGLLYSPAVDMAGFGDLVETGCLSAELAGHF